MTPINARAYAVARQRLGLPPLVRASVSEYQEATTCTGCTARQENGIRVVYTVRGCPVHTTVRSAA